jgi:large subunit ribosomal protein L11
MQTIKVLIDAGKASAGPPLGPALGPLGVNTLAIVNEINEKTKDLDGMKIPVIINIDSDKSFSVEVGSPQISALIKKELGIKKAVGKVNEEVSGNLSFQQLKKITKAKYSQLVSRTNKSALLEVIGSCRSAGVTIENISAREFTAKIKSGEFDSQI